MQKSVLNLVRGGVFALAAVAAFAFTQPINPNTDQYAQDPDTGIWYNLTGIAPGSNTYFCETASNKVCRVDAPDESGMPIHPSENNRQLDVRNPANLVEVQP
ncbi:hypothetical protein [Algoriphagus litoralis]|uniref:hypothetical protein n=1 Tax=Algoriphagus litoralis TaxID=2202829 RepID=UPI000DB9F7D7|nr:hypothetical protein [Algoriphagus litoralis]